MKRMEYFESLNLARETASAKHEREEPWSLAVCIFSSRETPHELEESILRTIGALGMDVHIDVLVNGNELLASQISASAAIQKAVFDKSGSVRIWSLALGNKAHAWNQFIYVIAPPAELYLFLDGYVKVNINTLDCIQSAIKKMPHVYALSGTPSDGRSSEQVRRTHHSEGGIHGNLFVLKRVCVAQILTEQAVLPVGLYGFDTVLGGMLGFGLNPSNTQWDIKRFVFNDPALSWRLPEKSPFNWKDVRTQLKRMQNNVVRKLVRQATIFHFESQKKRLDQLEVTVDQYILAWARNCRFQYFRQAVLSPLAVYEITKLSKRYSAELAMRSPVLIVHMK